MSSLILITLTYKYLKVDENVKNYFLLTRPLNMLISGLAMIVSAAILDSLDETRTSVLIILTVMSYTAGKCINDVLDLEIDKINRPFRPIPSKNLKKDTVLKFSFTLFLIGSVLPSIVSAAQFIS